MNKNTHKQDRQFMEVNMQSTDDLRKHFQLRWIIAVGLYMLLMIPVLTMAESTDQGGVLRSRVYKLNHITSEEARESLSRLNIGQNYNALTAEVLILTSNSGSDLLKASEVLQLIDQDPAPVIRTLMTGSENVSLLDLDAFTANLDTLTVGTMTDSPERGSDNPAIIDIVDNQLIAIASEDILDLLQESVDSYLQQFSETNTDPEDAVEMPMEQVTEIPVVQSTEVIADEPVIEPNLPGITPKPNDLPDEPEVVEPVMMEERLPSEPNAASPVEESIPTQPALSAEEMDIPVVEPNEPTAEEPVMQEKQAMAVEPNEPTTDEPVAEESAAEPNEDFLSEELMETLAQAEAEQIRPEESADADVSEIPEEAAVAVTDEPVETDAEKTPDEEVSEETAEDDGMKVLQAFLAQVKAEEAALAEEQAATKTVEPEPVEEIEAVEKIQTVPPQDDSETLKAELAELRQRLAELEAKTTPDTEPQIETVVESSEPKPEPAAESKIQTSQAVQTEPQLDPKLSEKELNTVIDLPQEIELESLVDLVGKQLGLNYMYDPSILKNQKVKLKIHGGKIKVRETYALLESILRQKGFVMTRRDPFVVILKANDAAQIAKRSDLVIREPHDPIPPGAILVRTKFTLKHISPTTAQSTLNKFQFGMSNGFQEIPENNSLIVTDYAYRMDQIHNVIKMIDVAGEKKEYEFRTLQFMKPSEMVPKLQSLSKELEGVSLQISTPAPAQKTRTVTTRDPRTGKTTTKKVPVSSKTPAASAAAKAGPDTVYIDTDDRTNRILIAGSAEQIKLINELIDALDVPQYDLKFVREYVIQNVEALEVVDVLNELDLVTGSVSRSTSPARTTPARGAGTAAQQRAAQQRTSTPAAASRSSAGGANQPSISIRSATNSLLVNATAEQHEAIELVIAHVDVVQKDQRTIRQYEIQYVDTQEIIDTLTDLGIIAPGSTSSTSSRGRTSRSSRQTTRQITRSAQTAAGAAEGAAPVSLPTAEGGTEKEITAEQPQISVLETTNSLLVYATPRQHEAIALVIGHADRQLDTITTPYVVYNLENQNAVNLAATLNELIQETFDQVNKKSSPDAKIQTAGGTPNIPMLQDERPKVIGDERSNSIIVYGNKRNQQWISELVKELDQNRYQVLLDVTLVEISKNDLFNYDLDLISAVPDMTSLSGALDYGIGVQENPPSVSDILDNLMNSEDGRNRFKEATSRGGKFNGFYGNEHIMALLELMQKKGYGRVLNRPRILVNDNEPGTITLETVTYREIQTIVNQGSDTPVTSTQIDYRDYSAGITLEITPHISQEDRLRLEITLNRSDFDIQEDADESLPPDTINSDVQTVVTVPDESTVILGGLDRITQSKDSSKVPILGDIPILGGLFRSIGNSSDQRKIYIFVRANILRPGEDNQDLKDISEKNIEVFEYYEREMQGYEDWPGIKPTPINPPRILREEEDILDKIKRDNADEEVMVPMREES